MCRSQMLQQKLANSNADSQGTGPDRESRWGITPIMLRSQRAGSLETMEVL